VRGWEPNRFNALSETVEGERTEGRATPTALGYPTERGIGAPILQVPSLQQLRNQPEKPLLRELLREDRDHHLMI
jgi:hypothetical protein